jgi:hypothetical protein
MALALAAAVSRDDPPVVVGGGLSTPESPGERLSALVESLRLAFTNPSAARRLAELRIVVRIDLVDVAGPPVTLLLDRPQPEVIAGAIADWPALRLWMKLDDLEAIFRDRTYLPIRILSGEVRFEGMVHKLLRVMPAILRAAIDERDAA